MCNCGKCSECTGHERKEGKEKSGYSYEKKETSNSGNGKTYKKEEYTEKKEDND